MLGFHTHMAKLQLKAGVRTLNVTSSCRFSHMCGGHVGGLIVLSECSLQNLKSPALFQMGSS